MMETLRILKLLLYKNFLIRKRQWKMSLIGEFIIPVGIIACIWAIRNFAALPPERVKVETWPEPESEKNLTKRGIRYVSYIYFTPKNDFTRGLIESVRDCIRSSYHEENEGQSRGSIRILGYDTEEELLRDHEKRELEHDWQTMAVIFDDNTNNSTKNFKYKIRTENFDKTDLYVSLIPLHMLYYYAESNPFAPLQLCLDKAFIHYKTGDKDIPEFFIQRIPYPPYTKQDIGDQIFRQLISMFTVIALLIPLFIEVSRASSEKFLGINVLMSMNGVSNALNLFSWLLSGFIFLSIFCILPINILINFSTHNAVPFLYHGDPVIIWLVYTLHLAHLLSYGIHISAYFSRSLLVIFGLLIINICSMVLQLYALNKDNYPILPYLGIFFPNLLIYRAIDELNHYEETTEGIHWNNLMKVGNISYEFGGCIGMILILSIIGFIFHFTMAVYIYAINPGKYGVRKHPLFFLKRGKRSDTESLENLDYGDIQGKPFESVPQGVFTAGIQIRNLKKTYNVGLFNKTQVNALRGVSLNLYKGQITSLLGHNGAGKTTMMSILTGMMSPSDGTIFVNSKDIKSHINEILNEMGLCTQENMIFPNLTISEQMQFFAWLKGKDKSKKEIEQNINAFLKKLKLYEKRHSLPADLSGGQKRRVCLGMALVGDPSTLVLDEPTSGLDPESRRVIWDILLKMRGQKTILISTHDMEEADILGDRIAILHAGQLRSYGTSMFLKKLIGEGNVEVTLSVESGCDTERIRYELSCEGKIINQDGSKMVISVPNSPDLPESLDNLEKKKAELGISGLSVSLISLEQVFLKVTQEEDDLAKSRQPFIGVEKKLTGQALVWQSIRALLYKKMTYTMKNISTFALMLLLIILSMICISFILKELNVFKPTLKITEIKLDMYSEPVTYVSSFEQYSEKYKAISESFNGKSIEVTDTSVPEALMDYAKTNLAYYDKYLIAAAEFNSSLTATAFYSTKAIFSFPISLNLLTNTVLKVRTGDDYSISLSGQQLPNPNTFVYRNFTMVNAYTTTIIFVFLFCPTIALFVLHPLRESSTNVKQLQRMAGVSYFTYWGTMFIFDLITLLLVEGLIMIGFISMDRILELRLYEQTEILILLLTFVLVAINLLPLIYIFSFVKLSTSSVVRLLTYIPLGIVSLEFIMMAVKRILFIYRSVQILRPIQKYIFLLVPYVSFFHSQMAFYTTALTNSRCRRMPNAFYDAKPEDFTTEICYYLDCYDGNCKKPQKYFTDFKEDVTLEESLLYLGFTPILYFGILALLEYQVFQKLIAKSKKYNVPESTIDENVKKEKTFIAEKISTLKKHIADEVITANGSAASDTTRTKEYHENSLNHNNADNQTFLVYELRKRYGKLLAVKDVSFRVNKRECFGLLGVNGAGKSTTFRMMTGGEVPDKGLMYIGDKDFKKNKSYFLSQMGYCPQNDAIIKSLNAYDHLRLFARLRGIPENLVEAEVMTWIQRLNLSACASQASGTYSGGNKRRLNIAIALIGIPNLVLLDEPTTGVDPGARRSLWNVIQSCQTTGQAVVLTSHSMEECEALCNRLAIMVEGKFVCMGPSQELKQRFGAGYDIQVKLDPEKSQNIIDEIKNDVVQALNCQLTDENLGYLMYHVMPTEITWRKMYNAMNAIKRKYDCIDDFSILSSTLEQLFLLFAKAANDKPKNND